MKTRKTGFTLVELLVVIAIIGILVALLLPAVQAAHGRQPAASNAPNNLKQLGIAMLNFHDTKHQLPVGNVSCCWGTWQMMILPFLEEQALGDLYQFLPPDEQFLLSEYRYDAKDPSHDPAITNRDVCEKRIATLTCPSDEPQVDSRGLTYHNYVVNYGNTNHIGWDHLGPGNPAYVEYLGGPFVGDDWNAHPDTEIRFREIKDGLSKTLLAAETVQGQQGDLRGFTWWGWAAGFETLASPNASDPDTMQYAEACNPAEPNPPCIAPSTLGNLFRAAARSRHAGGVNAVALDGSVRFVTDSVDLATWRAASTSQGEEIYHFTQ